MSFINMNSATSPLLQKLGASSHYYVHDFWDEQGDSRISHFPMMSSGPWSTMAAIAVYLWFVKIYGPQMMKNRKPLNLKDVMVCYNFIMVFISGWMFYEGSSYLNFGLDTWGCANVDYSRDDPATRRFLFVCWLFFFSKIIEFSDTVFMVLRKKFTHVSSLHVIHHSVVPLSVWLGLKFAPGGSNGWFPLMNSLVHTLMYAYYGMSALAPTLGIEKRLNVFKPWITRIQMGQFCLAIVHCVVALCQRNCDTFPQTFLFLNLGNALLFLGLFYNFYRKVYLGKVLQKQRAKRCRSRSPTVLKPADDRTRS